MSEQEQIRDFLRNIFQNPKIGVTLYFHRENWNPYGGHGGITTTLTVEVPHTVKNQINDMDFRDMMEFNNLSYVISFEHRHSASTDTQLRFYKLNIVFLEDFIKYLSKKSDEVINKQFIEVLEETLIKK